jgi:hypothetical protein
MRQPWRESQPPSHLSQVSGHDIHLGHVLGQLLASTHYQTRMIERIAEKVDAIPTAVGAELAKTSASKDEPRKQPISPREWLQIGGAVMILAMAVAGKLSWGDALSVIRKMMGL